MYVEAWGALEQQLTLDGFVKAWGVLQGTSRWREIVEDVLHLPELGFTRKSMI